MSGKKVLWKKIGTALSMCRSIWARKEGKNEHCIGYWIELKSKTRNRELRSYDHHGGNL